MMTVTGVLLAQCCDWSVEKVGSVWRKRPCSLTDLAPTLSEIYDSRWCAVLIKIDYRALLVLCPSVIVLLSLYTSSFILFIFIIFSCTPFFHSFVIWCFIPAFVTSRLSMHLTVIVEILSFITMTHHRMHIHTPSQAHKDFLSMTLLKEVIIIGGKKLSASGENDTAANGDTAMTSSMSIRDQDIGKKMSNQQI